MRLAIFWISLCVPGLIMCGQPNKDSTPVAQKSATESSASPREKADFYDNGQVKSKGMTISGKRHGLWQSWYPDGVKWSETTYLNDQPDGPTISWYPNGIMRYQGRFRAGKKVGIWTFYDEEGLITHKVNMDEETNAVDD